MHLENPAFIELDESSTATMPKFRATWLRSEYEEANTDQPFTWKVKEHAVPEVFSYRDGRGPYLAHQLKKGPFIGFFEEHEKYGHQLRTLQRTDGALISARDFFEGHREKPERPWRAAAPEESAAPPPIVLNELTSTAAGTWAGRIGEQDVEIRDPDGCQALEELEARCREELMDGTDTPASSAAREELPAQDTPPPQPGGKSLANQFPMPPGHGILWLMVAMLQLLRRIVVAVGSGFRALLGQPVTRAAVPRAVKAPVNNDVEPAPAQRPEPVRLASVDLSRGIRATMSNGQPVILPQGDESRAFAQRLRSSVENRGEIMSEVADHPQPIEQRLNEFKSPEQVFPEPEESPVAEMTSWGSDGSNDTPAESAFTEIPGTALEGDINVEGPSMSDADIAEALNSVTFEDAWDYEHPEGTTTDENMQADAQGISRESEDLPEKGQSGAESRVLIQEEDQATRIRESAPGAIEPNVGDSNMIEDWSGAEGEKDIELFRENDEAQETPEDAPWDEHALFEDLDFAQHAALVTEAADPVRALKDRGVMARASRNNAGVIAAFSLIEGVDSEVEARAGQVQRSQRQIAEWAEKHEVDLDAHGVTTYREEELPSTPNAVVIMPDRNNQNLFAYKYVDREILRSAVSIDKIVADGAEMKRVAGVTSRQTPEEEQNGPRVEVDL